MLFCLVESSSLLTDINLVQKCQVKFKSPRRPYLGQGKGNGILSTFTPLNYSYFNTRRFMFFLAETHGFLTSLDIWDICFILLLAVFLGIEVISNVPAILHTPLMSGANAIHGVVIIGSIIVMGHTAPDNYIALVLGFLAVVLGTLNVVGGFVVTNRMLQMFKKKKA